MKTIDKIIKKLKEKDIPYKLKRDWKGKRTITIYANGEDYSWQVGK